MALELRLKLLQLKNEDLSQAVIFLESVISSSCRSLPFSYLHMTLVGDVNQFKDSPLPSEDMHEIL